MCGRYALRRSLDELLADLAALLGDDWAAVARDDSVAEAGTACQRFNIRPSSYNLVLRQHGGRMSLGLSRWGFQPPWMTTAYQEQAKRGPFINARAETLTTQRAFASAAANNRCLVMADGFYESGAGDGPKKQPYFFEFPEKNLFFMAGVEAGFPGPDWHPDQANYAILTQPARPPADHVHHRMPVILSPDTARRWLGHGVLPVRPLTADTYDPMAGIRLAPVSRALFKRDAEGPGCLAPPAHDQSAPPAQGSLF